MTVENISWPISKFLEKFVVKYPHDKDYKERLEHDFMG